MASGLFTVEMDELEYRIAGPDDEIGTEVDYGEVATLRIGDALYYAVVDDPDVTDIPVYRVDNVTPMPSQILDVEFGDGDEVEAGVDVAAPESDGDDDEEETEEGDEEGDEEDDEEDDETEPGEAEPEEES